MIPYNELSDTAQTCPGMAASNFSENNREMEVNNHSTDFL